MEKLIWHTEQRQIKSLSATEGNPRQLTKKQAIDLEKSIKKFNLVDIPAINTDNRIISGHQRIAILKALGRKEEEIDVRVPNRHLTEEEHREYLLRANKNTGEWNIDLLANFDEELLKESGWDSEELDDIFQLDMGDKDDEVPEVPEEPKSKMGDIYELGNHRIMAGDATKKEDCEKLMNGKKADMAFCDPPYGIDYQSNMRTKTKKFDIIKNDEIILIDWIPMLDKFSKGFIFIWTTWKIIEKWFEPTKQLGKMTNMVVWSKGGGGIGDLKKTFSTDYEIALVFNRNTKLTGKRIGSVWKLNKDFAGDYKHPTQKPVELAVEAITKTTNVDDIVLDLFLGSGSTLIACEKANRICYGMELDLKYIDVIVQRYVDFTGNKEITKNGDKIIWE